MPTFLFVPLDAKIWIHLTPFLRMNHLVITMESGHSRFQGSNPSDGWRWFLSTWNLDFQEDVFHFFWQTNPSSKKDNNNFWRAGLTSFQTFFLSTWVHHPSIFRAKNKYNKAKQTPMMHWISEIRFRHNINTYNKYLETTMQPTFFFHPKNLQIPKFAFPAKNSIRIQAAHPH